jgi:hypothetical protein
VGPTSHHGLPPAEAAHLAFVVDPATGPVVAGDEGAACAIDALRALAVRVTPPNMAAKKSAKQPTLAAPQVPRELPLSPREVDARTFELGRAWWGLMACEDDRGVVTSLIDGATASVDLRAWPPTLTPLAADWTRSALRSRDGTWAFLVGWTQQRILVSRAGDAPPIELPMPKKKLGFAAIGFAGERVVAIPGPLGHDNESSPLTCAQALMIESEGKLFPVASDVDAGGDAYELCGGVSLLDGTDVVVWSGRVLAWNGARFVRHAPDLPRSHLNFGLSAAPFGDGFFCAAGKKLLLVRSGAAVHEQHAPELSNVVAVARAGDDVVVTTVGPLAHHRYQPRTGAVQRIDTSAIEDVDMRVFSSPVGLVASAKQRSRLVRLP